MKLLVRVSLLALGMTCLVLAQQPAKPRLQRGIHVELPVASHITAMPAADERNATVVSVTADGNVFLGVQSVELSALSSLNTDTIYIKADARVPYQKLLAVLDALHGRSAVLLTAPPKVESGNMTPPYGMKVMVGQ